MCEFYVLQHRVIHLEGRGRKKNDSLKGRNVPSISGLRTTWEGVMLLVKKTWPMFSHFTKSVNKNTHKKIV